MKYNSTSHRKTMNLISGMLLAILVSSCNVADRKVDKTAPPSAPPFTVLLVRDYFPSALAVAKEWQPDAYLLKASVTVKLPHQKSINNEVSFEFRSPENKNISLIVFCEDTCSFEEVSMTMELPQCLPLDVNDSLLESKDALELAIKNGGTDYINHEGSYISMYLERDYPRCNGTTIAWRVLFGNVVSSEQVSFLFDAVSGELLETRH